MKLFNKDSALTGTMITAGTSIGAGMFSIPIVCSGMWFELSIIALLFIWFINYLNALYLLEVNLGFERGDSFDKIVKTLLGDFWNPIFGIGFAFLMAIVLYAYFSAFGNMTSTILGLPTSGASNWLSGSISLIFGLGLAIIVWWSTTLVGKISSILIIGMTITFFLFIGGFSFQVEINKLLDTGGSGYFKYSWASLSYLLTAFAFSTVVPSLYKHYGNKPKVIKKGMLIGSLLAFVVYLLFIFVIFGNISRDEFVPINQSGGNISDLVSALQSGSENQWVNQAIALFSNFAIISSFLGIGLCLFDYVADKFELQDNRKGRFYSALITFLPSGVCSFFFPHGFITAIGYAGLVAALLFIAYFFIARKFRISQRATSYRVPGGNTLLYFFLLANVLVCVCQLLSVLGYLPVW
ncbi:aromatic amino acid transport family protein [Portibacter lacus]|uniref:High affinity tryptophan transporter Mtr n=1 Tax=Portibacter lacus TaxID=1099794 RepID=A0AA37SRV0_9BACT|nr:aromatic amino acid transport family protein [Portibacter lacus]GLR16983.1 high affinity tryptophan transporter Mtr [Portibacter lacus]